MNQQWIFIIALIVIILWSTYKPTIEGYYYNTAYNPRRGYYRQSSFPYPINPLNKTELYQEQASMVDSYDAEVDNDFGLTGNIGPYRFPYWRNIYRVPRWGYSYYRLPYYRVPYDVRFN